MEGLSTKDNDVQVHKSPKIYFSRLRIVKNAIVLSVVFFITFVAYDCLSMLQSTLNHDNGIGVICQAIVYACFCFSSLLFPKYVIQKLGCKVTLVLSMSLYLPYIASNLYPHWAFMVPASIINGLFASLLWGSQCIYLNEISVLYASLMIKNKCEINNDQTLCNTEVNEGKAENKEIQNHCKGTNSHSPKLGANNSTSSQTNKQNYNDDTISTSIKQVTFHSNKQGDNELCKKEKNIIPSKQLNNISLSASYDQHTEKGAGDSKDYFKDSSLSDLPHNTSESRRSIEAITARFFGIFGMAYLSTHMWSNLMSYFILHKDVLHSNSTINSSCLCGAQFCNVESECFIKNLQEPSQENRALLTGLSLSLGVISILLLVFFLDSLNDRKHKVKFSWELIFATCKHSKKRNQILLIPLSFYIGMMQGFYTGDFNVSYVGCAWGTYHVALVSVCYGAACGLSSPLSGWLVKKTGRVLIFVFAALINGVAQFLLLMWKPNANNPAIFFVIAALWGTAVGVLWSQLKAMYGFLFKEDEEAAFAAFHLWYSLGFCLSFAYSNQLCTYIKIYVLILVLILGVVGYLCVELGLRRQIK